MLHPSLIDARRRRQLRKGGEYHDHQGEDDEAPGDRLLQLRQLALHLIDALRLLARYFSISWLRNLATDLHDLVNTTVSP